eukprot:7387190-Prymnesium_polylepis.2
MCPTAVSTPAMWTGGDGPLGAAKGALCRKLTFLACAISITVTRKRVSPRTTWSLAMSLVACRN